MIEPTIGELASGLVGVGRMAEPEDILSFIEKNILQQLPLNGKQVLILDQCDMLKDDLLLYDITRDERLSNVCVFMIANKQSFITQTLRK